MRCKFQWQSWLFGTWLLGIVACNSTEKPTTTAPGEVGKCHVKPKSKAYLNMGLLHDTKTAKFSRTPGRSVISFCVDRRGKVVNVMTEEPFPGDPEIDAILQDVVKHYRFYQPDPASCPELVCTKKVFNIVWQ